jgi:hypothetical protein
MTEAIASEIEHFSKCKRSKLQKGEIAEIPLDDDPVGCHRPAYDFAIAHGFDNFLYPGRYGDKIGTNRDGGDLFSKTP